GDPGRLEARRHGARRRGDVPRFHAGVDLDQFLVDVARELLKRRQRTGLVHGTRGLGLHRRRDQRGTRHRRTAPHRATRTIETTHTALP
ncbi:MAG: hypothetical protein ACK55I_35785, partial [bacterium]